MVDGVVGLLRRAERSFAETTEGPFCTVEPALADLAARAWSGVRRCHGES